MTRLAAALMLEYVGGYMYRDMACTDNVAMRTLKSRILRTTTEALNVLS